MKKILQSIILIFFSFGVKAQFFTPVHNYQAHDGFEIVKHLGIPYGADTSSYTAADSIYLGGIKTKSVSMFYQTTDSVLYIHDGKWRPIKSNSTDTALIRTIVGDSVATKLNKTDSVNATTGYTTLYQNSLNQKKTDSVNVSLLNGGKIDTSRLPVSNIYIQQSGAGETQIVRASNDTTLSVATLKNTDDITVSKASDSAVLFQFTHPHYTKAQVDSIAAGITSEGITRAELQDTADNKVNKTDISGGTINQVLKKNSSTDYDWSWQDESGGGGVKVVIQTYTGSSSVTIADSTTWLIINPASLAAAMTITLPENPANGQDVVISFGGTITSGTVVAALTISPNTGQSILQASTPSLVESGESIKYRYEGTNKIWYRI